MNNGYTTAENNCTGCMGPCGQCKQLDVKKMDEIHLIIESKLHTVRLKIILNQLNHMFRPNGLTLENLKQDIEATIKRLFEIETELERRVIP